MRVLVSGASGLIGSALVPSLGAAGHDVATLVRRPPRSPTEIRWGPREGRLEPSSLEGFDAVVHLSGARVDVRWGRTQRDRIVSSRVETTRLVSEALAGLDRPPAVLVSASAIGFYGDRGDAVLDEDAAPGRGFLPQLGVRWEAAADAARARGIRVVHPRIGLVLSRGGGALARLLPVFRLGAGGPIGDGRSWWSWIAMEDLVAAIGFALTHEELSGPVNAVAPQPVRNAAFARALGRTLGRPAWVPVPALALRAVFGTMAEETVLASTRVTPARLIAAGYRFRFGELDAALAHVLQRRRPPAPAPAS